MKNVGGFLAGILGGAIVGAAIGLLFAPEKGEDTRNKIVDTLGDTKDKVIAALEKRGIKLSKSEVEDLVDELKAKVETQLD
ncbi:MAG: YtxH domain-containing protein [Paludibacteraceae bacterium]